MGTLLRTVRGLLGIGAAGAVAGGLFVASLVLLAGLISGAIMPHMIGLGFLGGAGLGLLTTTVFGAALAVTSRGRLLEELSVGRATAVSGLLGAVLPIALVVLGGDAVPPIVGEAPAIVICGLFGAFLGGGTILVGKEARLRELQAAGEEEKLVEM